MVISILSRSTNFDRFELSDHSEFRSISNKVSQVALIEMIGVTVNPDELNGIVF